ASFPSALTVLIAQPKYGACTLALGFSKYLSYIAGGSGAGRRRSIGPLNAKSRSRSCLHSNHLLSQCTDSVQREASKLISVILFPIHCREFSRRGRAVELGEGTVPALLRARKMSAHRPRRGGVVCIPVDTTTTTDMG